MWSTRLRRVAEYALARKDSVSFEDLVEVINLIDSPTSGGFPVAPSLASSGLLQFRRLQLVERASRYLNTWNVKDRPLYRAWIIAQGTALRFFEPDAGWHMPASMYWALYERNAREPWDAEEPATRAQLSAMRASLARVSSPKKAELLQLIEGLEAAIPR